MWPRGGEGWGRKAIDLPANSTIKLLQTAGSRDVAFATVEGMLTPTTLMSVGADGRVGKVQSLPAQFDAQLDASSGDGPIVLAGQAQATRSRDQGQTSLNAPIGKGGPPVRLRTGDGPITVSQ